MKFLKWMFLIGFNWVIIYQLSDDAQFSPEEQLESFQVFLFVLFFAVNIPILLNRYLQYFVDKDSFDFREVKISPQLLFVLGTLLVGAYFFETCVLAHRRPILFGI